MIENHDPPEPPHKTIGDVIRSLTREQLIAELENAHSEEFVLMFLCYLTADLLELHQVSPPRLKDAWDRFKREMGK